MSEKISFTPSRLALARQRRGMTLVQLAEAIGLTPQSLSNAENGRQHPSESTIERIAEALKFPVDFFLSPDLEELEDVQLSFRARSKTTKKAKNAVKSSARIAIELRRWIDDRFVTPSVDLPTLEGSMSPELAAEHVRARWGVDLLQSIPNAIHLLESKGVAVFSLPPEYRDVDAFSFWWGERPFVMLSTMKSAERSRFDAAHELGHLVMHRYQDYGRDWRTAEREANQFASSFLMPRANVVKHMPLPATTDRIIRTKKRWKVAAMALAYRLQELELLTEWTYRQVVIELGRLGYRGGEPNGIARETSQLLAKVFGALRAENFSLRKVAEELAVDSDELRDITFGLLIHAAGTDDTEHPARPTADQAPALRLVR